MTSLLHLILAAAIPATASFLSIGDWGSASLSPSYQSTVSQVAKQMNSQPNIDFIVNTGDNFYYCGIQSIHDPQV
jgi:hypothetical protein